MKVITYNICVICNNCSGSGRKMSVPQPLLFAERPEAGCCFGNVAYGSLHELQSILWIVGGHI